MIGHGIAPGAIECQYSFAFKTMAGAPEGMDFVGALLRFDAGRSNHVFGITEIR